MLLDGGILIQNILNLVMNQGICDFGASGMNTFGEWPDNNKHRNWSLLDSTDFLTKNHQSPPLLLYQTASKQHGWTWFPKLKRREKNSINIAMLCRRSPVHLKCSMEYESLFAALVRAEGK